MTKSHHKDTGADTAAVTVTVTVTVTDTDAGTGTDTAAKPLGDEFIPRASDREEVGGGAWVLFEAAAEAGDEVVDCACVAVVAELPDAFEKLGSAQDTAGVLGEVS